jgi:hypothetical protein
MKKVIKHVVNILEKISLDYLQSFVDNIHIIHYTVELDPIQYIFDQNQVYKLI